MTSPMKFTKLELSKWAEAYEKEHGIHCEERIKNNEERRRPGSRTRARDARDPDRGRRTQPLPQGGHASG